jgi:hypothetical protein
VEEAMAHPFFDSIREEHPHDAKWIKIDE